MNAPRLIVIGLDSVPPALAFEHYSSLMPNLNFLIRNGVHGRLRSTDPPITIPAWITMTSGMEPKDLGIYGFRSRVAKSYVMKLVSSIDIPQKRLWDLAANKGFKSVVVSVPPTYPIPRRPGIDMTSCFLTPDCSSPFASDEGLMRELTDKFGPYIVDVENFRADDKLGVAMRCEEITRQHFGIFRHLIKSRKPDFAMLVDIGPDRFHHCLLSDMLPTHPLYDPTSEYLELGRNYYHALDDEIGKIMSLAGSNTVLMVVSDHGVKPLKGGVCINELLIEKGLLRLNEYPNVPTVLSKCDVDWKRSIAWGEGGYHSRIFLNIQGREPMGTIDPIKKSENLHVLSEQFELLRGPSGEKMANIVHTSESLYGSQAAGFPPDIIVYWDELSYRSIGTVGHGSVFLPTNDTGPDQANHDFHGILVMSGGGVKPVGLLEDLRISDVFATAVKILGLDPPKGTSGRHLT